MHSPMAIPNTPSQLFNYVFSIMPTSQGVIDNNVQPESVMITEEDFTNAIELQQFVGNIKVPNNRTVTPAQPVFGPRLIAGLTGVFIAAIMAGLNNRVPALSLPDIRDRKSVV